MSRYTTNQAVAILGELYQACQDRFDQKIHDAYLYGSYARGDFHADSDIDIFLTVDVPPEDLRPYRETVAHICSELGLNYDVMISAKVEPLSQFQTYQHILPYYQNVLKDGIRYH